MFSSSLLSDVKANDTTGRQQLEIGSSSCHCSWKNTINREKQRTLIERAFSPCLYFNLYSNFFWSICLLLPLT